MKKNNKVSFELERKKVAIPASMVTILILIAIGNQTILSQNEKSEEQQSRNIATIAKSLKLDRTQTEWEQKLAMELSSGKRDTASIGKMPDPMEQFRFGVLGGNYQLHMEDGKISNFEFIDNPGGTDRPKYLKDSTSFMNENAKLFAISFHKAQLHSVEAKGAERVEHVNLLDDSSKVVGHADFLLDEVGRLRSLKLQKQE